MQFSILFVNFVKLFLTTLSLDADLFTSSNFYLNMKVRTAATHERYLNWLIATFCFAVQLTFGFCCYLIRLTDVYDDRLQDNFQIKIWNLVQKGVVQKDFRFSPKDIFLIFQKNLHTQIFNFDLHLAWRWSFMVYNKARCSTSF